MNAESIQGVAHSAFNLNGFAGCILSNPSVAEGLSQSQLNTPL
jgi:hypothetical protein